VLFHTSHPGLVAALRRDKGWIQVSAVMYGNKKKPGDGVAEKGHEKYGALRTGYGGHFRAVQGFRYLGEYVKK
jgi:hypothetical protein